MKPLYSKASIQTKIKAALKDRPFDINHYFFLSRKIWFKLAKKLLRFDNDTHLEITEEDAIRYQNNLSGNDSITLKRSLEELRRGAKTHGGQVYTPLENIQAIIGWEQKKYLTLHLLFLLHEYLRYVHRVNMRQTKTKSKIKHDADFLDFVLQEITTTVNTYVLLSYGETIDFENHEDSQKKIDICAQAIVDYMYDDTKMLSGEELVFACGLPQYHAIYLSLKKIETSIYEMRVDNAGAGSESLEFGQGVAVQPRPQGLESEGPNTQRTVIGPIQWRIKFKNNAAFKRIIEDYLRLIYRIYNQPIDKNKLNTDWSSTQMANLQQPTSILERLITESDYTNQPISNDYPEFPKQSRHNCVSHGFLMSSRMRLASKSYDKIKQEQIFDYLKASEITYASKTHYEKVIYSSYPPYGTELDNEKKRWAEQVPPSIIPPISSVCLLISSGFISLSFRPPFCLEAEKASSDHEKSSEKDVGETRIKNKNKVEYENLERLFSRQETATPLSDYYTTPVLTEKIVFNNIEKKATGAEEADVYQENIFKTVKRISLKDIFSDAATLDKKNNVAIVWGAPGVGKTILSRYCTLYFDDNAIVFLFEVGKLENLSLNKDLLKTLIDNFYADFGANFSSESLESWMNERKEKIIFILDGIDEGSSKQALLNKLITQISQRFRLIITSRALDFDDLVKTNLKSILSHENVREFEAIGFDDAGIDDFITKYFRQENQSERRHNFLAIIQKNKIIWNIAHNPMQLELICFLATLENTEQNFFQDNRLTLSKLYQKIEMKVLNRQISSDKHPEIKAHKNEIIIALSRLGYHMFFERDNEKQISGEKLEQAIKNSNQSEITISNFIRLLVNTGFIRETGKSNDISDMQYYFSHKSLQEYFAAKYISNNFETSSDVKRIIISHRYDYRYILVWRFVAGILYYEYNITKIDDYFSLLLSYPREVVGSRHLFLMAASIDEMMLDTNISVVNKLFEEQLKFLGLFLTKTNQESFWYQELARSQFILDSRAFSKKLYEVISSFDNQYHPNRDENVFFLLDHMKNVPQNIISKFYDKSLDSVKYQFLISLFKKKIISPETAVFLIDTYENLLINHNYLRIVEPLLESRLPLIDNELSKVVRSRINFSNLENLDFVKEILLIRHISLTIDEFEKIVNAVSTYQKEMPRQVLWYFRHRNMNTNEIQFLMNKIEGDESISYRVNIANLLPIIDKFNATQRTDIFKIINDSSPLDEAIKKPIVNNLIETNLFLDGAELDLLFWLLCKWSDCKNNDYLKRQVNAKIVAKALFDDLDNLQDLHALSQMASTSFKFNSIFDKVISFEKKDKSNDMVYHSLINLTKKSLSDSQISAIWDVILDNKVHNHYRRQLLETLVTNNDRPDFCERLYSAFVNNTGNFDFYNIVGNVIVNHLKLNDEQFEKMLEFFVSNIDSGNPILSFYASKLKQFSVAKINPEHLGFLANREIMWNIRNFRELRCHWFAEDPYIYLSKLSSMNFSFAFLPTCIDFFISSNYFFLYEEGVFYFPRDNLFMAVEIHRDYMSRISSWAWNNNSFSLFLNNYNLQRMDFPINPENIYSVANASKSKLVNKEIASNYGLPHQQTGTGLALALCEDNDCYQNTEDRVYPKTDFIGALVKYTKVPTSNPDYVPQFDMGRWEDSHNHDITSEPIYLYRVFRLGQEVGSATFYGEKCFCRSENGLRHNVISRSGVLTNFEIDPSSIQKICSSLPPSNIFEKMFYYSQFEPAICHGAIQGIAEVISKAFHRSGKLTQNTANNLRLGLSCFIPFIFNTLSRYQRSNQDGLAGLYEAAYDATFDIVDLFLLTALFQLGVFLLKTAVLMFNRNNNSVSSKVNCVSSSLGRYGIYACNAISIGVCPVIEGLVKVTAAEKVVTSAGDFLINRFISGSNSKSGPKVSFSD